MTDTDIKRWVQLNWCSGCQLLNQCSEKEKKEREWPCFSSLSLLFWCICLHETRMLVLIFWQWCENTKRVCVWERERGVAGSFCVFWMIRFYWSCSGLWRVCHCSLCSCLCVCAVGVWFLSVRVCSWGLVFANEWLWLKWFYAYTSVTFGPLIWLAKRSFQPCDILPLSPWEPFYRLYQSVCSIFYSKRHGGRSNISVQFYKFHSCVMEYSFKRVIVQTSNMQFKFASTISEMWAPWVMSHSALMTPPRAALPRPDLLEICRWFW